MNPTLNIFANDDSDSDGDSELITRKSWLCRDLELFYSLSLIAPGHGNSLWNASACISEHLAFRRTELYPDNGLPWPPRSSFEFGAGAALPSMVLAKMQTETVFVSDQKANTETFAALERTARDNAEQWNLDYDHVFRIVTHNWGEDIESLQVAHPDCVDMDVLVASDCIYNPEYHGALLESASRLINKRHGLFIVGFSFHTNVEQNKVLGFFDEATAFGFKVVKQFQKVYDSQLGIGCTDADRGTVFVKVLAHRDAAFFETFVGTMRSQEIRPTTP